MVLGKTVLSELAYGGYAQDVLFPPPLNPLDPMLSPGGSSSGSAVAVAAGLCPLAIGTDTAGSVRIPAAHCGIVGFKPSYRSGDCRGIRSLAPSMDHWGLLGRTAEDLCFVFALIQATEAETPPACDLRGLKLATLFSAEGAVDPQSAAAVDGAGSALRRLGARVEPVALRPLDDFFDCGMVLLAAEAWQEHARTLRLVPHGLGANTYARLLAGSVLSLHDIAAARRLRAVLTDELQRVSRRYDLILCPATRGPTPALTEQSETVLPRMQPTVVFNLTGQPAISLPWPASGTGGTSVQLAGRHGSDARLLRLAAALESSSDR